MLHNPSRAARFAVLAGLSAIASGSTVAGLRALQEPEEVPFVDALVAPPPGREGWPFVSVIVPARNEERNLPRLLPSLLGQHYPDYEVIVVDDQSEDATPQILADWACQDARLKVIRGRELPEGWLGKPYAMFQGAQAARGSWLLFTDADTVHDPLSLSSSVAYAVRRSIDLLTIGPCAELLTPSEKLLMPVAFMGITVLYPAYKVNDPNSNIAIANGQYMLFKREVYEAIGGAARVRDKIAEDLELGKAVKRDGYRLYIGAGTRLMKVRMYTNLEEVWQGWSKNVVLSFRNNPGQGLFAASGLISTTALPIALGVWSARSWRAARNSRKANSRVEAAWAGGLAVYGMLVPIALRVRIDQMLDLAPGWALTQPLGMFVFGLLMLNSLVRLLLGKGVVWKGRTYASRTANPARRG